MDEKISKLNFPQKQRLAFIDFLLMFQGEFCRKDLTDKFEMGMANATRDITLYRELAPENAVLDNSSKSYVQSKSFVPLFDYDARKTLIKLANNISDGFDGVLELSMPVESPHQLNVPDIHIVAKVVQAIINKKAVSIIYTSLSSGSNSREIVPHTIVDNGLRWHVRAFDRKSNSFRDFVLTRISNVIKQDKLPELWESKEEDHQWQRIMTLQIVPHPNNVKFPTAIALDYGMNNGVLELKVRAALAGYLLRRWNVDCSSNAESEGAEYQLALRNIETLYGAENLYIAPGYSTK